MAALGHGITVRHAACATIRRSVAAEPAPTTARPVGAGAVRIATVVLAAENRQ